MQNSRLNAWLAKVSQSINSSDQLEVSSPFSGEVLASVDVASEQDVEDSLERGYGLFRERQNWIALHERISILERCARLMTKHHGELVELATSEGGKPLSDSQVEITRAIASVRLCAEHLKADAGKVIPISASAAGKIAFTQYEPQGLVVAVSAFNHPLNLIVHQVAPAVAAGCPVIVKPSPLTPLSCLRFVELLIAAGLPEAWVQVVVTEDNALAERLITDKRLGFFSFVGSAPVGWMLRSKLSPGVRCALEHGGAAPVILAEDADLDIAIASILKGGFYHAGQVCVSVQRVFAHSSIADDFAKKLAAEVDQLICGDPMHINTQIGPLIHPREVNRVHSWVEEAVSGGAIRLGGGVQHSERFYPGTVLLNPLPESKVSNSEIFGPVVSIFSYEDMQKAIRQANNLPFAFQAAVFTRNTDIAMQVFAQIDASAVMVNDHTAFRVDGMPFAGLRQSGLGVGGIPHTLDDMRIEKMLVMNSASALANL